MRKRLLSVSIFQPVVTRKCRACAEKPRRLPKGQKCPACRKTRSLVWWFGWRDELGRLKRETTGTRNKNVAKQLAAQLTQKLQLGAAGIHDGYADNLRQPWKQYIEEFMEKKVACHPEPTRVAYLMCLNAFTRVANPKILGDINLPLLDEFVSKRMQENVSPVTVNKELRHLRACLNWLKKRRYLPTLPDFEGIFLRVDNTQPTTIPEADFVAMIEALKQPGLKLVRRPAAWWRVFLYVAYYCGFRRGELLGLGWERVSFERQEILVTASSSKGKKDRLVPMTADLVQLLREWHDQQRPADPQAKALPWEGNLRGLYPDWHRIQAAAGIPEHQHYLPKHCRSSCASALIAANVPTAVVKDFLGHSSVVTTEKYYLNTTPALRAAANARKVKLA